MNCALIGIGTELLFGQVTNTNTVYLSQKLNQLGINVLYHFTVGDNPKRLKEIISYALEKNDLVITTGGLGPTQDDLTKEMVAEVLEDELVLHQPSYDKIVKFLEWRQCKMAENNVKQAYLPENAEVFKNDRGTAPGFALEKKGKIAICLPGPPHEMKGMYEGCVFEYLQKKSSYVIHSKMLRFFGIGEAPLEIELNDLISSQTDPTIAPYAKVGEVSLRVTSRRETLEEAQNAVNEMCHTITEKVGQYIYSYEDEELIDVVTKKLIENNISISVAESCTGGAFANQLTDTPGISKVFDRSIVTYSNQAKMDELGVKQETLNKYGAVSEETAIEMVKGLKDKTNSRVCLSVTGIAGPGGGTEEKPVGLVYIAIACDDEIKCEKHQLSPDRFYNRKLTLLLMLNMLNKLIDERIAN